METLLLVLDLVGAFVFALSGATAGVKHRLDLFGVVVLSYAAGNAGGITRDLLIGAVPPAAVSDWRYLAVSLLAGVVTFWWPFAVDRLRSPVLIFDAAGLALFAVAGTQKALAFGLNPIMAALLGMLTGIGGGMARDLLLAEIPTVLRADLYALAALAGAAVYGAFPVKRLFLGFPHSSLFGAGKAVLRPVACDQVPGARGRGQGTETLAELGGVPP